MPNPHWGLDIAYNFDAIQQNTNVCFASSVPPANSFTCVGDPTLLETYGFYETHTQYGYFALNLTPIQRLEHQAGIQHRRQPGQHDDLQSAAAPRARWPRRSSRR